MKNMAKITNAKLNRAKWRESSIRKRDSLGNPVKQYRIVEFEPAADRSLIQVEHAGVKMQTMASPGQRINPRRLYKRLIKAGKIKGYA